MNNKDLIQFVPITVQDYKNFIQHMKKNIKIVYYLNKDIIRKYINEHYVDIYMLFIYDNINYKQA